MENQNINTVPPKKKIWKFRLLMGFIFIGLAAVVVRLFLVQVVNSEDYQKKAVSQHQTRIKLNANRGDILDRDHNIIATTFDSYTVAADPVVVEDPELIASEMVKITGGSKNVYLKKMKKKNDRFVELKEKLYPYHAEKLRQIDDRGLILLSEPQRLFEYGSNLAQVIGLTNTENIGISGLELKWNTELTGQSGFIIMNRDGLRRLHPSADLPVSPAKDGNSLVLTVDIGIQEIVENELKKGVLKTGAASGTVVALKPQTGEILAIASYPNFNPNTGHSFNAENRRIRAITDSYEPGSTFKIITAAAALEENIVAADSVYNGYQGYYAGSEFEIKDIHRLGKATFREAIIHSSNIIFSQVAHKIPSNVFYKYIRDFGFGITLGVELPGEVSGKVKKPEKFSGVTKRYMGHGYELSVTPLQLANAYATIANKGKMMKPYIVKKVLNNSGRELKNFKPQQIRRVISESTADTLTKLFKAVVDSGTGKAAKIKRLKIVGKTGTAQQVVGGRYSKQFYTGSFAGYFPAENPQIAMIVIIDKPKGAYYGGSTAAPIFKNITAKLVSTRPFDNEEIKIAEDSLKVPHLKGLTDKEAGNVLEELGLELKSGSSGIVTAQTPEAGAFVPAESKITVSAKKIKTYTDLKDVDLKGLPLNRTLKLLNNAKIDAKVRGSGKITDYYWKKQKDGKMLCVIRCG